MRGIYNNLLKIKSTVPIGKIGDWTVERFEVSEKEADFHNLRCAIKRSYREIEAGKYTKLTHCNSVIMSDTPAEINDHLYFMYRAKGDILVNGLGLGLVTEGLMLNPDVKHLTVIEISPEVIRLVGEYLKNKHNGRLSIVNADAFVWNPPRGKVFDSIWHDIWPAICGDYYDDMKRLHRKYAKKTKSQNSWCRDEIRRAAKIN